MPVKFEFEDPYKGAWVLLRQVYNLISRCEDKVFSEFEVTPEQHTVLMAIKHIDPPVRPTDIARWLDRSVNSVSMIIDRMVKAGLVRRVRDRKDRRTVFLTMTGKAEKAYELATAAGWELVREILSPLSDEDRLTLIRLLETLRDKTYAYMGSGGVVEEVRWSGTAPKGLVRQEPTKYRSSPTPGAKRRGGRKKKAM
jgi:DNA-binding MarR family transcriptional regulator